MNGSSVLGDEDALRSRYRRPSELVLRKQRPDVDAAARAFIEASPLMILATTSSGGTDASPRGGPPGFVTVLDPGRLAFGDLAGNNRLDSYANVVAHPEVGMLFLVPGVDETLRVNGRAHVTTDAGVRGRVKIGATEPNVAVVVEVTQCFVHCGKALRRAGVWDPTSWATTEARPSAAAILAEHLDLDVEPAAVAADLEAGYAATLWTHGGTGR